MKIAILLYEGLTALDAVGPYEILSRLPGTQVQFVAKQAGPCPTDTRSLSLVADFSLADVPQPDIVLVPGGMEGTFAAAKDETLLAWVRAAHLSSRWTLSVCTGALILGAAGLLNGLKATTHWFARGELARYGATYVPERFVHQGKIITAAGVSAGLDMALYLAKEIAGENIAKTIQLSLEYDPQPPFESGSLSKASPLIKTLAEVGMASQLAREKGQAFIQAAAQTVKTAISTPLPKTPGSAA